LRKKGERLRKDSQRSRCSKKRGNLGGDTSPKREKGSRGKNLLLPKSYNLGKVWGVYSKEQKTETQLKSSQKKKSDPEGRRCKRVSRSWGKGLKELSGKRTALT